MQESSSASAWFRAHATSSSAPATPVPAIVAVAVVALAAAGLPDSVRADAPAGGDNLALQEIVVSATRLGDESIQKIPMAISVISPAALDAKGLSGISDFVGELPSVNMQSVSPGENVIDMRGLVTNEVDPTNAQERSLVALYLDDSSIGMEGFNPDLHVYDLERVEVIRGPQGTLYGAGSMAGTIRLITKKPDPTAFLGDADLSVSETQHGGTNTSIRGMVNLPLIDDKLAARLVLYRSDDSGYIDNVELGERDANPAYATQGRLAVRWLPSDTFTLDVSALFARLNAQGRNTVYPQLGAYTYESLTAEQLSDYFKLYNITADWDLSFAHLISSSSYTQRQITEDESYESLDEYLITPGTRLPAGNQNGNDVREFQQELRLVSRPDQPLRWIAGAYFERDSRFYPQNLTSPGFDSAFGAEIGDPTFNSQTAYGTPAPDTPFYGTINLVERQLALFGEATYSILPRLDLTLGARYFNFKDDFDLYFTGVAGAIAPGEPDIGNGEQRSTGVNPRGVLTFKVNEQVIVYGEAARGFRYGGVNEPAPVVFCASDLEALGLKESPPSFGPDHLWSYTLGEKGTFNEGRWTMNVDGFYIDWDDVQTQHLLTCGYSFAQNAGKITSQGLEWESKVRATSALTLGLSGSYTDATANGPIANLGAAGGDRAPFFPRNIVTASADYDVPLPQGKIEISTDYTYRSRAFTDFSPTAFDYTVIPSSVLLNGSIGYMADQWSLSVFGTNLTNNHLVSIVDVNTNGPYQPGNLAYWGRPRTIGVHAHVKF
ncbi:MAG TPA: TonB-dependent receptor [Steroidobacteraceae bacterium]|nr:TonB-dependent receptor [Steroidobacteraceae bacterium]